MNIERVEQIYDRIEDVGKQMNALRRERARHEKSIEKHDQIIDAYQAYIRIRPLVESTKEPQAAAVSEYKKAYTVLAQNQILTAEAYAELCRRRDFEKQKIIDYDKRIPELKKQYHDLKKLQALAVYPTEYLRQIYSFSERAWEHAKQDSERIDDIINNARSRTTKGGGMQGIKKNIDIKWGDHNGLLNYFFRLWTKRNSRYA